MFDQFKSLFMLGIKRVLKEIDANLLYIKCGSISGVQDFLCKNVWCELVFRESDAFKRVFMKKS